jgi:hypothetical protein
MEQGLFIAASIHKIQNPKWQKNIVWNLVFCKGNKRLNYSRKYPEKNDM